MVECADGRDFYCCVVCLRKALFETEDALAASNKRVAELEDKTRRLTELAVASKVLLGHQEHGRRLPLDWLHRKVAEYESWLEGSAALPQHPQDSDGRDDT